MRNISIIILSVLAISCQKGIELKNVPEKPAVNDLLTVVQLLGDSTEVVMTDYFPNPSVIDSVCMPNVFSYSLSGDKSKLTIKCNNSELPKLNVMDVWVSEAKYSLVLRKGRKIPVNFEYNPSGKKVKSVQLTGQINDWNPAATPLSFD
ncbi:MAG TPA: hypothetical protein PKM28_09970, partial [Tenuifilaceae bacterium]|nr:hypothetical protein [Tenuifilaceae bacterium]